MSAENKRRDERETKKAKSKIGLYLLLIIVLIVLLVAIVGLKKNNSTPVDESGAKENASSVVENTTNLSQLSQSEYTSDGFATVEMGDSVATVSEKVGELYQLNSQITNYDVYTYDDTQLGSKYVFYFDDDKLSEVSVFLI